MAHPRRPLPPATVDILLALLDGPAHGYGIKKAIAARTQGHVRMRAATLYEALHRLDQRELIEELEEPPAGTETGTSRWRFYRLTAIGRHALRTELARMDHLVRHARARGLALQGDTP